MRYFLNRPTVWTVEVTEYALLFLTFLGAAWVLKNEGHVRRDAVLNRLNPINRALLLTITSAIGAIVCLVLFLVTAESTYDVFQRGVHIASVLEPPKALILGVIPIGSFLLFIQFLRMARGNLRSWRASRNEAKRLKAADTFSYGGEHSWNGR